jgi:hypothetical protein
MSLSMQCKHLRDNCAGGCPTGCCYMLFYNEENEPLEWTMGRDSFRSQEGLGESLAVKGSRLGYKGYTGLYFLGDGKAWYVNIVTGIRELRYGNE